MPRLWWMTTQAGLESTFSWNSSKAWVRNYIQLSVYPSLHLSFCLSVCLSVCLSIWQPIYLSLSIQLSVYPSVYLSVYPSVCLSVYPSVCLSVSVYPSVCLSICLCLSSCLSIHLSVCSGIGSFRTTDICFMRAFMFFCSDFLSSLAQTQCTSPLSPVCLPRFVTSVGTLVRVLSKVGGLVRRQAGWLSQRVGY